MERHQVYNRIFVFFVVFFILFYSKMNPLYQNRAELLAQSPPCCPTMFPEKPRTNPTEGPSGAFCSLSLHNCIVTHLERKG